MNEIIIIVIFQAIFLLIGYYLGRHTQHNIFNDVNSVKLTKQEKEMMRNDFKTTITSPFDKQKHEQMINDLTNDKS